MVVGWFPQLDVFDQQLSSWEQSQCVWMCARLVCVLVHHATPPPPPTPICNPHLYCRGRRRLHWDCCLLFDCVGNTAEHLLIVTASAWTHHTVTRSPQWKGKEREPWATLTSFSFHFSAEQRKSNESKALGASTFFPFRSVSKCSWTWESSATKTNDSHGPAVNTTWHGGGDCSCKYTLLLSLFDLCAFVFILFLFYFPWSCNFVSFQHTAVGGPDGSIAHLCEFLFVTLIRRWSRLCVLLCLYAHVR